MLEKKEKILNYIKDWSYKALILKYDDFPKISDYHVSKSGKTLVISLENGKKRNINITKL